MSEIVDMKRSLTQDKNNTVAVESYPEYSYGLTISLDEEEIAKLGIEMLPNPGMGGMIQGKVIVKSASINKDENGKRRSLCLQITKLAVSFNQEEEMEEVKSERMDKPNQGSTTASIARVLFSD